MVILKRPKAVGKLAWDTVPKMLLAFVRFSEVSLTMYFELA